MKNKKENKKIATKIINEKVIGDPLADKNLNQTLRLAEKYARKGVPSILITSFPMADVRCSFAALRDDYMSDYTQEIEDNHAKRKKIVSLCDVIEMEKSTDDPIAVAAIC